MKVICMAGGYATRLWPLTTSIPKPLLPLGRKRVLDYIIEKLESVDEIEEILISTNSRFSQDFEVWAENQSFSNIQIVEEKTRKEKEKLGTIGALSQFTENLDEEVLVIAGDNYFPFNFTKFINYFHKRDSTTIAVYDLDSIEKAKNYGVVNLSSQNQVLSFVEKPKTPSSSTVSVACYLFPAPHFKLIEKYLDEGGNPDAPGHFIQWLCSRKDVYGFKFKERPFDIGTPDSYMDAFKELTEETFVSKRAKIGGSVKIEDPVIIEKGAIISGDCKIGPYTFIQPRTEINFSRISDTIVFENSQIKKSTIKNSLIGKSVQIKDISVSSSVIGHYTRLNS